VYDSLHFDLSFPRGTRPYLVALQAGGRPPFDPEPRGFGKPEGKKEEGGEETKPVMRIDTDGLERRIAAFPVAEGLYRQIAGIKGKALWTVFEPIGAHGRGGHREGPGRLESFEFETVHKETLLEKIDAFSLSHDGKTMVVREGKRLRALEAGAKPGDKAEGFPEHSRKTGGSTSRRIRVSVDPVLEWRQMLREVWRLQRDQFWVTDMSGVNWEAMYRRYEPLLARVATRGELSDLIWELHGELGTSHAYEFEGDHRKPPALSLGALAADLRFDAASGGYEIVQIATGDAWDAGADSPLNADRGRSARRRAHSRGERAAAQPRAHAAVAAGAPGGRESGADARLRAGRRNARCSRRCSRTKCRRGTAIGSRRTAAGCTSSRRAASAMCTCPT
jgi:tricorn protease